MSKLANMKPSIPTRGTTTERGYGWRWQKAREPFLSAHPLCRPCEKKGYVTTATAIDHIIPHKGDETLFWDQGNWQPICKPCHDLKTITEDGGLNSGVMTHPEWLPTPACPVTLVTGPAGAGKTTYARHHAKPEDMVIDLDDCFTAVCGVHGHDADRQYLKQAIRLRNKQIASLATKRRGTAFVIVTSPAQKECDWWKTKLDAEHVLLDPGQKVCESRTKGERQRSVRDWYAKAKSNDWKHPSGAFTKEIGRDGWPIDERHPVNR